MAVLLTVFVARASGAAAPPRWANCNSPMEAACMLRPSRPGTRHQSRGHHGVWHLLIAIPYGVVTRKLRHCRHRPPVSSCCALSSGAKCGVVAGDLSHSDGVEEGFGHAVEGHLVGLPSRQHLHSTRTRDRARMRAAWGWSQPRARASVGWPRPHARPPGRPGCGPGRAAP